MSYSGYLDRESENILVQYNRLISEQFYEPPVQEPPTTWEEFKSGANAGFFVLKVLDPTGILSWPDFGRAVSNLVKDSGNGLRWVEFIIAFICVLPNFGLGILYKPVLKNITKRSVAKMQASVSKAVEEAIQETIKAGKKAKPGVKDFTRTKAYKEFKDGLDEALNTVQSALDNLALSNERKKQVIQIIDNLINKESNTGVKNFYNVVKEIIQKGTVLSTKPLIFKNIPVLYNLMCNAVFRYAWTQISRSARLLQGVSTDPESVKVIVNATTSAVSKIWEGSMEYLAQLTGKAIEVGKGPVLDAAEKFGNDWDTTQATKAPPKGGYKKFEPYTPKQLSQAPSPQAPPSYRPRQLQNDPYRRSQPFQPFQPYQQ
jgi:hypothetical protein